MPIQSLDNFHLYCGNRDSWYSKFATKITLTSLLHPNTILDIFCKLLDWWYKVLKWFQTFWDTLYVSITYVKISTSKKREGSLHEGYICSSLTFNFYFNMNFIFALSEVILMRSYFAASRFQIT